MSKFLGMKFGLILLLLNFINVDATVPLYPGCDTEACSNAELADYISKNIFFSSSQKGHIMYAGITIDENGQLSEGIRVHQSISSKADDQIYRLYGGLKNRGQWTPRTVDGTPVSTTMLIPLIFQKGQVSDEDISKLRNEKEIPEGYDVICDDVIVGGTKKLKISTDEFFGDVEDNQLYKVVDQMPRFRDCTNISEENYKKRACADKKLVEYIYTNLTYPSIAKTNNVEGRVYIQFVVEKDGYLSDIKIVRDLGSGTGEAAMAVIEGMNNLPERWIPGSHKGELTRVLYTLPITFKLPKQD